MNLEERLKLLSNKLKEKQFWTELLNQDWPFNVEMEDDNIREAVMTKFTELAKKRIDALEGDGDTEDDEPTGPSDEEKAVVEQARTILSKYNKGSAPTPRTAQGKQQISVLDNKSAVRNQQRLELHGIRVGEAAELLDINLIESQNPTHKSEFVAGDKVKVAKIYTHPTTGRPFADILKMSESKGMVRARVPVDDLEQ